MKNLSLWCLCLVSFLSAGNLNFAQNQPVKLQDDEQLIEFTTDQFTLPNLHVTPDKKHIIFDVLGDIYQVPLEGGKAEVLLQDSNWKRAGKLSPDGKTLAYISDETGEFQVWTYDLDSYTKRVYPIVESIHYPLYAYWKNNKELLIPSKEGLFSYHIDSGKSTCVREAKEDEKSSLHATNRTMSVNNFSTLAGFQKNKVFWVYDFQKQRDLFVGNIPEGKFMTYFKTSPKGKYLLYWADHDNTTQQLKVWDLQTNRLINIFESDKFSTLTVLNRNFDFFDDKTIILDRDGEVVRMNIETGAYESIPVEVDVKKVIKKPLHREPQYIRDSVITASVLRNPVTQPDLDTIYFGAFGKLHTYSKITEAIKEVFPNKDQFEVSPSLSPNGKYLAYTTWNDWEMGHLYVREISTGKDYQITQQPGRYINPAWSPDGTEIVFIADETEDKMGVGKLSPGSNIYYYHLDLYQIKIFESNILKSEAKRVKILRIHPLSQLPRRFYPVPAYHKDGNSIYLSRRGKKKDLSFYTKISLDSSSVVQESPIPFHLDEALISPTNKYIAFIFDGQVWLSDFPYQVNLKFSPNSSFISQKAYYKGGYVIDALLPEAKSIFEIAPSYLSWQDEYTLMWGSADDIYTYDIRTQEINKIASIQVQKPRAVPKAQYALTNARIITMNPKDQIIEDGTILIKNNRIEAVGNTTEIKIPKDYKIFDLSGKTIIPGLIDVHAHYHLGPYEFTNQQEYQYVGNLAYGVTSIYDPSVNNLDYREQAQMVEVGDLLGPRIFASGNIIFDNPGPGQYSFLNINNFQDAQRIIKGYKKVGVSGPIKEYLVKNKLQRDWLRDAAKKEGIEITTHQENLTLTLSRIVSGYTSIEHEIGNSLFQKDVLNLIAQSKLNYTPTFMVSPRIGDLFINKTELEKKKLLRFNGRILYQNKIVQYNSNLDSIRQQFYNRDLKNRKKEIERSATMVKGLKDLGGNISVGGHGNPLPGIGTHMELWSFTYGDGLSNHEALQTATIMGAKKLNLQEEIGSLEEGKLADLVVLNKNPLDDIFNTTNILYTIQNGNIFKAETMEKILPQPKELRPWGRDSPIVLKSMENIYIAK